MKDWVVGITAKNKGHVNGVEKMVSAALDKLDGWRKSLAATGLLGDLIVMNVLKNQVVRYTKFQLVAMHLRAINGLRYK